MQLTWVELHVKTLTMSKPQAMPKAVVFQALSKFL
jgi:hypothetical protein